MRRRDEGGETLVEILIAVVIMGLVVGAIFATYAAAATSSKSQRDFVTADTELRDYAEAVKAAAESCTNATPGRPLVLSPPVSPPTSPYPFPISSTGLTCPQSLTSVQPVDITVELPGGTQTRHLSIDVRTP